MTGLSDELPANTHLFSFHKVPNIVAVLNQFSFLSTWQSWSLPDNTTQVWHKS